MRSVVEKHTSDIATGEQSPAGFIHRRPRGRGTTERFHDTDFLSPQPPTKRTPSKPKRISPRTVCAGLETANGLSLTSANGSRLSINRHPERHYRLLFLPSLSRILSRVAGVRQSRLKLTARPAPFSSSPGISCYATCSRYCQASPRPSSTPSKHVASSSRSTCPRHSVSSTTLRTFVPRTTKILILTNTVIQTGK
uniref:Uncharacterized protein n=1 Tax=Panagrellus redivivus TaxID=6233 RepID=A0A7E4VE33_PANRE